MPQTGFPPDQRPLPWRAGLFVVFCGLVLLGLAGVGSPSWAAAARSEPAPPPANNEAQAQAQAPATPYTVYLPLLQKPGARPDSTTLIETAEQEGRLDAETALLYQVYAIYADPKLPAEYRGDDSQVLDRPELISELGARFEQLSPPTQEALRPYLIPPVYAVSWYGQRIGAQPQAGLADGYPPNCGGLLTAEWDSLASLKGTVRVWWQRVQAGDEAKARAILNAVDSEIWDDLTRIMQRAPLRDDNDLCNGGDNLLDIYLAPVGGVKGSTKIYGAGCEADSTYILLDRGETNTTKLIGYTAHEIMHAIQFSYDVRAFCVGDYGWLLDATANWAIDYALPHNNTEHDYANWYLHTPKLPLDDQTNAREYGAYLFPFFISRTQGPDRIRQMWEATQNKEHSLDVVDSVIGGFTQQWPTFATYNWNRDPVKQYQTWDQLQKYAVPYSGGVFNFELGGKSDAEISLPVELPRLSTQYYAFTFSDTNLSLVSFYNGWTHKLAKKDPGPEIGAGPMGLMYVPETASPAAIKGANLKALVKIKGRPWEIQDWSNAGEKSFCLDTPEGRLEQLVLIFSNSEWREQDRILRPEGLQPVLRGSNMGCHKWKGQITARESSFVHDANYVRTAQVTFEHTNQLPGIGLTSPLTDTESGYIGLYRLVPEESQLHWEVSGEADGCVASGSGTISLQNNSATYFFTYNHVLPGVNYRSFFGSGMDNTEISHIYTCDGDVHTHEGPVGVWLALPLSTEGVTFTVSPDGKTMQGSYTHEDFDTTFEWTLEAQREP